MHAYACASNQSRDQHRRPIALPVNAAPCPLLLLLILLLDNSYPIIQNWIVCIYNGSNTYQLSSPSLSHPWDRPPVLFLFSPIFPAPIGVVPASRDPGAYDLAIILQVSGYPRTYVMLCMLLSFMLPYQRTLLTSYRTTCNSLCLSPHCSYVLLICIRVLYIQQVFD